MIKGRVKFGNLYLLVVLFSEIAVFGAMIWNCKHISEMFYFSMMGLVFIIPCVKELIKNPSSMPMPSSKTNDTTNSINTSKNDVKQVEKKITDLKDYKKTNNKKKKVSTKGYQEFNNLLISSMKGGLMNRECVLKLKHEVRHLLGTHVEVYIGANSKFKFDSDMHEIYVLSKSSHLKEEDYIYLINFLSSNLDLSSAEEVIE